MDSVMDSALEVFEIPKFRHENLSKRIADSLISAGAVAVGITEAAFFGFDYNYLRRQKRDNKSDLMEFTFRNPRRSADIRQTFPYAKSVIVAALDYPREPSGIQHFARYVQNDYYGDLRKILVEQAVLLREEGFRSQVVLDQNHLLDKAAARRAGLGWIGKNSLLLVPKVGSNVVIGSIITDASLPKTNSMSIREGCGECTRCMTACPTGALDSGSLDASKCISWLLQRPGVFPEQFRESVGERMYGCDTCQDVCPIGKRGGSREKMDHPIPAPAQTVSYSPLEVLSWSDQELLDRLKQLYIPKRSPSHMRRNALLALGNASGHPAQEVIGVLIRYERDADPILREQARWSLDRLGVPLRATEGVG